MSRCKQAEAATRRIGPRAALPIAALLLGSCQFGTRPNLPESPPRPARPAREPLAPATGSAPASKGPGGEPIPVGAPSLADLGVATADPAVPPPALGGPVPMYRGDAQHTGRSPFTLPHQLPHERWRFTTTGSITAAPALASDGTIIVGSHDGYVYALTAGGSPRWRYRTADMVWATPALAADGTIYIGSDDDRLYALALSDGVSKWSVAAGTCKRSGGRSPEGARCDVDQVTLGADGTLYIGGDGVYAIRSDGTVRWHFDPGVRAAPTQPAPPDPPPAPGPPKKVHCASAPSIGRDGMVYAICQEVLYALGPDGSKRWEFAAQGEFEAAPALAADGTAYLGSDDRRLYAVDPLGQVRFTFLAGAPIRTAVALQRDGSVVFGCDDDALYSVRGDGTLQWSFRTADAVRSSPLIDAAGSVVFGSRDDRLYAVAADGRLKWSVLLDADVDGTPALGPDGTIYIGTDDQALHALQ